MANGLGQIGSDSGDLSGDGALPRRQFLSGLGSIAAGLVLPSAIGAAQAPSSQPGWIDVHSHFTTPNWVKVFEDKARLGLFNADQALPSARAWSPAKLMEDMDKAGVSTSVLSMTWPGIWFGENQDPPETVRRLARDCNDSVAKLMADHPGRVGLFAVLPLPDVDGSLQEIEYALDKLKADGIGLLSSYDDKWFGDPLYAPVFQELNRRKAIVFVHPKIDGLYGPAGTDTHRTIASFVKDGASSRYPDLRFIFAHGGGTMPYLIERIIGHKDIAQRLNSPAPPNTQLFELRRFFYDTAAVSNPAAIATLRKVVPVSQILFGTDYNYRSDLDGAVKQLSECGELNAEELRAVGREQALKLLPRYKT